MSPLDGERAAMVSLLLQGVTVLFHLLVVVGFVPYDVVWGGRLRNRRQMLAFETLSLSVNLSIGWLVSMRLGYVDRRFSEETLNTLFWACAGLFSLNTLGNLLSKSPLERTVFTPITSLLAIAFATMARDQE